MKRMINRNTVLGWLLALTLIVLALCLAGCGSSSGRDYPSSDRSDIENGGIFSNGR